MRQCRCKTFHLAPLTSKGARVLYGRIRRFRLRDVLQTHGNRNPRDADTSVNYALDVFHIFMTLLCKYYYYYYYCTLVYKCSRMSHKVITDNNDHKIEISHDDIIHLHVDTEVGKIRFWYYLILSFEMWVKVFNPDDARR